jgi:hypothetical protein
MANFEVPHSKRVGCGAVSTDKGRLSTGEYCLHIRDRAAEV